MSATTPEQEVRIELLEGAIPDPGDSSLFYDAVYLAASAAQFRLNHHRNVDAWSERHIIDRTMGALVVRMGTSNMLKTEASLPIVAVAAFGETKRPNLQEEYGRAIQKAGVRSAAATERQGLMEQWKLDEFDQDNLWQYLGFRSHSVTHTFGKTVIDIGIAGGMPNHSRSALLMAMTEIKQILKWRGQEPEAIDYVGLPLPVELLPPDKYEPLTNGMFLSGRLNDAGDNIPVFNERMAQHAHLPALLGFEPVPPIS